MIPSPSPASASAPSGGEPWTPGLWRIAGKGTIRAGDHWIGNVNWRNRDVNARLIAAAPNLAAALADAIALLELHCGNTDDVANAVLDAAKAALAAARFSAEAGRG